VRDTDKLTAFIWKERVPLLNSSDKTLVAVCIAIADGKVAFVMRKNKPAKGFWMPPMGHFEKGIDNDLMDTAFRETMEETRLIVDKSTLIFIRQLDLPRNIQMHIFSGKVTNPKDILGKTDALVANFFSGDSFPLSYNSIVPLPEKEKFLIPFFDEILRIANKQVAQS
jgi:ADP-ribose pyrophosphatase YjhB (NUDIX family)